MNSISETKFNELAQERNNYCISIYIPTQKGRDNRESIIKLKNQLFETKTQLIELGQKNQEIDECLAPIQGLTEDSSLWRFLSESLIIFKSKDTFFYTSQPVKVSEFSLVSDRFYLLPLLDIFNNDQEFLILTLSLKNNKLYRASKTDMQEVYTMGFLPNDMEDTAGRDFKQKSLQYRAGQTHGGFGLYHGQGEGKDDKETEVIKYLQAVDHGINKLFSGNNMPLIVASVESIFSKFQKISSYKNIFPDCIHGNFDHYTNGATKELHQIACEMLKTQFEESKLKDKEKYEKTSDKITTDLDELIRAANNGRIETLFVGKGEHVWGDYDQSTGKVKIHEDKEPMDNCLLDFAARSTFMKGGRVFIEERSNLPANNAPANAILRY